MPVNNAYLYKEDDIREVLMKGGWSNPSGAFDISRLQAEGNRDFLLETVLGSLQESNPKLHIPIPVHAGSPESGHWMTMDIRLKKSAKNFYQSFKGKQFQTLTNIEKLILKKLVEEVTFYHSTDRKEAANQRSILQTIFNGTTTVKDEKHLQQPPDGTSCGVITCANIISLHTKGEPITEDDIIAFINGAPQDDNLTTQEKQQAAALVSNLTNKISQEYKSALDSAIALWVKVQRREQYNKCSEEFKTRQSTQTESDSEMRTKFSYDLLNKDTMPLWKAHFAANGLQVAPTKQTDEYEEEYYLVTKPDLTNPRGPAVEFRVYNNHVSSTSKKYKDWLVIAQGLKDAGQTNVRINAVDQAAHDNMQRACLKVGLTMENAPPEPHATRVQPSSAPTPGVPGQLPGSPSPIPGVSVSPAQPTETPTSNTHQPVDLGDGYVVKELSDDEDLPSTDSQTPSTPNFNLS